MLSKTLLRSIIIIILSTLFLFYKYLLQIFPGVITDFLMAHFSLTGVGLGNLAACFFYAYFVAQLFAGPLIDHWGVRRLCTVALLCASAGVFLFALANNFSIVVIGRLLMGLGAAFATVAYLKSTANWCAPRFFALVAGLLTIGVMLGAIFGEAPVAYSVITHGVRFTLFIIALIGFILAISYALWMRDGQDNNQSVDFAQLWHGLEQIIAKKQSWILAAYSGMAFAPLAVFGGLWGTPFIMSAYALPKTHAASLVSLCYIGFGLGGPLFGWLSDRDGKRLKWMNYGLLMSLVGIIPVIYWQGMSLWILGFFMFVFGVGTGSFMLGFAVGKEANSIWLAASIVGFINSGDAFFGAVTEPVIGKLLDHGWHGHYINGARVFSVQAYHHAFSILPVYLLFAGWALRSLHRLNQ